MTLMNKNKKEEYNNILRTLGKSISKSNRKILFYIEEEIFNKIESKEEKHEKNYFYKFVFYYFKDHLIDKKDFVKIVKSLLENWLQILVNIIGVFFVGSIIISKFYDRITDKGWLISGIILLITSIITGSFFLIKTFIENLLNKKEKEMLNDFKREIEKQSLEFSQKLKEQTAQQNEKIDQQNDKIDQQNEKIDQQSEKIDQQSEKMDTLIKLVKEGKS